MITLGKAIYSILKADATITGYTTSIYPLVLPKDTQLPAIVYERRSSPETHKDNSMIHNTNVEITIMDDQYTHGINIANAVSNALVYYKGTVEGVVIRDIELTGVDELYAEDAYLQKLTFSVKSV